jgi:hypothetical protein
MMESIFSDACKVITRDFDHSIVPLKKTFLF